MQNLKRAGKISRRIWHYWQDNISEILENILWYFPTLLVLNKEELKEEFGWHSTFILTSIQFDKDNQTH